MNIDYFVLVSVVLTFATGFLVASIIWGISWFLTPHEAHLFSNWLSSLFHKSSGNTNTPLNSDSSDGHGQTIEESENNVKLFHYHHGEN